MAAATRLTEPLRTSPTANMPGLLVSGTVHSRSTVQPGPVTPLDEKVSGVTLVDWAAWAASTTFSSTGLREGCDKREVDVFRGKQLSARRTSDRGWYPRPVPSQGTSSISVRAHHAPRPSPWPCVDRWAAGAAWKIGYGPGVRWAPARTQKHTVGRPGGTTPRSNRRPGRRRAAGEPYLAGSGDRVPAELRLVLAGYVGIAGCDGHTDKGAI